MVPDAPGQAVARQRGGTSYVPHLDGLRALAILGVLCEHFGVALPLMLRCGPLSVRFFFVLTGYFITLSLWKVQAEMVASRRGTLTPLWQYYLKRILRIGPPFYLALLIGALFGVADVRTNFFWLATFQANNYIAYLGYWPDSISHFWSLAVQEQFYMLWPIVVLTLPRRWFMPVMGAFIAFGLVFRFWCISAETSTLLRWVTIFGCIDSFAVGALIAYLKQARLLERMRSLPPTVLFAMPLVAFACFFLGRALMTLPENNLFLGLTESVDAIFLAWALSIALVGVTGIYARVLSWSPLVYLGRISYGVYVYHVFIIIMVSPLLVPYGLTETHYAAGRIGVLLLLTVAISSLSWHFLEQPFRAWKEGVGKPKLQPVPVPVSAAPAWTPLSLPASIFQAVRRISSTLVARAGLAALVYLAPSGLGLF
jgi:peptidoglycan/LPS O-acetylase OafA/YrhL